MQQQPVSIGRERSAELEPEPHDDPVCKMLVIPETAAATHEYNGIKYYFCMPGCRDKFAADPEKYLTVAELPDLSDSAIRNPQSAIPYTCPMHPENRTDRPRLVSEMRNGP